MARSSAPKVSQAGTVRPPPGVSSPRRSTCTPTTLPPLSGSFCAAVRNSTATPCPAAAAPRRSRRTVCQSAPTPNRAASTPLTSTVTGCSTPGGRPERSRSVIARSRSPPMPLSRRNEVACVQR